MGYMCGRYVTPDEASLQREFDLARGGWRFPANFNVAPSSTVPVIRVSRVGCEYVPMRWGLPVSANDRPREQDTFNARVESLATSKLFSGPWRRNQRCIIAAMGFYEWHTNAHGSKQPYYIHVNDQDVFGFAGLWERLQLDEHTVTESCAIITMPANELMTEIHNNGARMPAILTRRQRDLWLSPAQGQSAGAALRPYADDLMTAYAVSNRVDSPGNNDEKLIEPLKTDAD